MQRTKAWLTSGAITAWRTACMGATKPCTANMHQGWPKFTQSLWFATADQGLAALVYSPSQVTAYVAGDNKVTVNEETAYPFGETIQFTLTTDKAAKSLTFPFHLRIPAWCKQATVTINGQLWKGLEGSQIVMINRAWKSGDVVELRLPMHVFKNKWYENSVSVEHGPLTYALKMNEEPKIVKNDKDPTAYSDQYTEVRSNSPWNYGLLDLTDAQLTQTAQVIKNDSVTTYPWNLANAPSEIRLKAKRIPFWQLYNEMTGPIPYSTIYGLENESEEEITLIPYGCTTLRISPFPVVHKGK